MCDHGGECIGGFGDLVTFFHVLAAASLFQLRKCLGAITILTLHNSHHLMKMGLYSRLLVFILVAMDQLKGSYQSDMFR